MAPFPNCFSMARSASSICLSLSLSMRRPFGPASPCLGRSNARAMPTESRLKSE